MAKFICNCGESTPFDRSTESIGCSCGRIWTKKDGFWQSSTPRRDECSPQLVELNLSPRTKDQIEHEIKGRFGNLTERELDRLLDEHLEAKCENK